MNEPRFAAPAAFVSFRICSHTETQKWSVLQGHVDMVTEKNSDVQHDFFKDGIRLKLDGDWLKVIRYFTLSP